MKVKGSKNDMIKAKTRRINSFSGDTTVEVCICDNNSVIPIFKIWPERSKGLHYYVSDDFREFDTVKQAKETAIREYKKRMEL